MCREWGHRERSLGGDRLWIWRSHVYNKTVVHGNGSPVPSAVSLPCHSLSKQWLRRKKILEQFICLLSSVRKLGHCGFHGALKKKPRLQTCGHMLCLLCLGKCHAFFSKNVRSYPQPPAPWDWFCKGCSYDEREARDDTTVTHLPCSPTAIRKAVIRWCLGLKNSHPNISDSDLWDLEML